jgi:hypothetical protein
LIINVFRFLETLGPFFAASFLPCRNLSPSSSGKDLPLLPLPMVEEDFRKISSQGWASMIRKVFEVNPLLCPQCGAEMKSIAFITGFAVVDRIIDHLIKLSFLAEKPLPSHVFKQVALMAAEPSTEYL